MRKAFTLIELLIAVTIFSIIMFFLYKIIDQSNALNDRMVQKESLFLRRMRLYDLLEKDLLYSYSMKKIETSNKDRPFFIIETKNTLHRMVQPSVLYRLKDGILYRVESCQSFKGIQDETSSKEYRCLKCDIVAENVKRFQLYRHGNDYMVTVVVERASDIFVVTPLSVN